MTLFCHRLNKRDRLLLGVFATLGYRAVYFYMEIWGEVLLIRLFYTRALNKYTQYLFMLTPSCLDFSASVLCSDFGILNLN